MDVTSIANDESNTQAFVFHEATSEELNKLDAAEKKVEDTCQSFAEALDSTYPWLTKELLDIYEQLEEMVWIKEGTGTEEKWVEKTVLWGMAFKLLYEKHKDVIPEKLQEILGEMLNELSEYERVKLKSKSLKDMLRSCAYITSNESSVNMGEWRTFMPWNLGTQNWA